MLRNLTPEQRDAILQQIGGGGSTGGQTSDRTQQSRNRGEGDNAARQGADRDDANQQRRERTEDEDEYRQGFPLLKGDDTVIVRIDLQRARSAETPPG